MKCNPRDSGCGIASRFSQLEGCLLSSMSKGRPCAEVSFRGTSAASCCAKGFVERYENVRRVLLKGMKIRFSSILP